MIDFHTWLAEAIATKAHDGQVDKAGLPYIDHPRTVVAIACLDGHDPQLAQAAWLHDVVEDTDVSLDNLRAAGFTRYVIEAVESVTRLPGETYMDMIHRAAAHPLGCLVKMADNRHNFGRLGNLGAEEGAFLRKRYTRAYALLEAAHARREGGT